MNRPGIRRGPDVGLLAAVGGASAAGGLLAMATLWVVNGLGDLDGQGILLWSLVFVLVVGCMAGAYQIGPGRPRPNGDHRPPRPPPLRTVYDGHHGPAPVPPLPLPVFTQSAAPDGPLPPRPAPLQPAEPPWYEKTGTTAALPLEPTRNGHQSAVLDPVVDSSSARCEDHRVPGARGAVRRVVQCPRCAYFDVTVRPTDHGHAFQCDRCDRRWEGAPGQPWPATVVRPSRARPARSLSDQA